MEWLKINRTLPPIETPVFISFDGKNVEKHIFSKDDLKKISTTYEKKGEYEDDDPYVLVEDNVIYCKFWSFIPLHSPEIYEQKIIYLQKILESLEIKVNELEKTIESLNFKITYNGFMDSLERRFDWIVDELDKIKKQ